MSFAGDDGKDQTDYEFDDACELLANKLGMQWTPNRVRAFEVVMAAVHRLDVPPPVPMELFCPLCHRRHVDEGEFATTIHHTHSCQGCGHTWRPAVVPTVGVRFLPGFKNPTDPPSDREDALRLLGTLLLAKQRAGYLDVSFDEADVAELLVRAQEDQPR